MATRVADARSRRYDPVETRQRVLEAANHLFATQGFAKTGTADIARAADVSEGSIFYHFGSKRNLLEELGRSYGEMMIAAMQADDALEDLTPEINIRRCFAYCETHKSWEKLLEKNSLGGTKGGMHSNPDAEPFYRASRQVVVDWIEAQYRVMVEKRGAAGFNVPIAAALTYAAVGDALDLAFGPGATPELRQSVEDETVRFVCAACGMQRGMD